MPVVYVPAAELRRGKLPAVCVVTGQQEGVQHHPVWVQTGTIWLLALRWLLPRRRTGIRMRLPLSRAGRWKLRIGRVLMPLMCWAPLAALVVLPALGGISAVAVGMPVLLVALWLVHQQVYRRWVPNMVGPSRELIALQIGSEAAAAAFERVS